MTPSPAADPAIDDTPALPDYGPNNENLPQQLKLKILDAVREAQAEAKFIRLQEVLEDAQNRFYDMGIQHLYCRDDQFMQAQPGGTYVYNGNEESFGTYIDDYNIFTPFALIQRAKLSQSSPGIDFEPADPSDPDDIEASNAAEGMRRDFDRNNDTKKTQQEIIYHLQMGGRAILRTFIDEKDAKISSSRRGTPRRGAKWKVYGCLESKVPIFANELCDFGYLGLYEDLDIKDAKTDYPWIAKKITKGPCLGENAWERIARLGILQGGKGGRYQLQIGEAIGHLVTKGEFWLRLSRFEACEEAFAGDDGEQETITDDDGTERPKQVREKLAGIFPDGVAVCVIGQEYAKSKNESMDDCLSVGNAYIGKGQNRMPVMKPMIVVQDRFNTFMNYTAETMDFGVGSTYISCGPQEYAAIKKQTAQPGGFRYLKDIPAGSKIADMLYREPSLEIPASLEKYGEFLYSTLPQFQLAVPPSIWGEAMKDQKTAAGYQLASVQAMGILGVFWSVETSMMADGYYQNCLAVMNDAEFPEEITVEQDGKNVKIRKESLTKGNFRAYPNTDSGFPETTSSKRQTLERVVEMLTQSQSPVVVQFWNSPDNVAFILREEGLTEVVIDEAISREKQLREIAALLDGSPNLAPDLMELLQPGNVAAIPTILKAIDQAKAAMVQQSMVAHAAAAVAAQLKGLPEPPLPPPPDTSAIASSSEPVWPSNYHNWEARKCQDWLNSDDCHVELTVGRPGEDGSASPNVAGVLNVYLHWQEHVAMMAKMALPPMPPMPRPAPVIQAGAAGGGAPPALPAVPAAPAAA